MAKQLFLPKVFKKPYLAGLKRQAVLALDGSLALLKP
jgi:hypothetical protein